MTNHTATDPTTSETFTIPGEEGRVFVQTPLEIIEVVDVATTVQNKGEQ